MSENPKYYYGHYKIYMCVLMLAPVCMCARVFGLVKYDAVSTFLLFCREYREHVSFLDSGIKHTVELFEDFFDHDGKTTYIFTSDHGMTNWGTLDNYVGCFNL